MVKYSEAKCLNMSEDTDVEERIEKLLDSPTNGFVTVWDLLDSIRISSHPLRFQLLVILSESESVTVSQLREEVSEPRSRIEYELQSLVQQGLARNYREEDTGERVLSYYDITPAGMLVVKHIVAFLNEYQSDNWSFE